MGYAAVDGVEHSFTRADWENNFEGPGIVYRRFYSDGTIIQQRSTAAGWDGAAAPMT